jgi:2-haloacid dehalogenase
MAGGFWRATQKVNDGERPWQNFDELHLATLDELLGDRGIDLSEDELRQLVSAWRRLDPWPDVQAGLEDLRRDRIVGTLSNGHTALLVDLARHGDLRFDCQLSGELTQAYKASPASNALAPNLLGLAPDEVMLGATHPMDLRAARNAGLCSAFIDRPREYGPDSPRREDPDADYSVADLHELSARLAD